MGSGSSSRQPLAWIIVLMLLTVTACQGPAPSKPFDVVITERDTTLNPLNPKWHSQVQEQRLPSIDMCSGAKPYEPTCTSQPTWTVSGGAGCSEGHHNWTWATYEGRVLWDEHSDPWADDDYNINLFRPDHAGYTQANPDHLLMEFNSKLTIDGFDYPESGWWHRFHEAVDDSFNAAYVMLGSPEVIAFGVLGLDGDHSYHSELHPVVALAIHVKDDPNDDIWAIMAMNFGDEGWCSRRYEVFPSTAPIAFLLPRPGATDVTVTQEELYCGCDPVTQVGYTIYRDRGVQLWVHLPETRVTPALPGSPFVRGTAYGDAVHGEVHLRWTVSHPSGGSAAPLPTTPIHKSKDHEPEAIIAELIARMTPAQRRIFDKLAPKPEPSQDDHMRISLIQAKPPQPSTAVSSGAHKQLSAEYQARRRDQVIAALRAAYGGSLPPPFN